MNETRMTYVVVFLSGYERGKTPFVKARRKDVPVIMRTLLGVLVVCVNWKSYVIQKKPCKI